MKKFLFALALSTGAFAVLPAEERFFNGGFEGDDYAGIAIRSGGVSLVRTSYGRSLYLGKVVGGVEVEALPAGNDMPGRSDGNAEVCPHCTFELDLDPKVRYELAFDYMPGNIRIGGEFVIADGRGKIIRRRVLPVNNLDWNHVVVPFRTGDDGKVSVTFRTKSPADLGGMAVDNISVRNTGDLLPRWGSGNILIGDGELPGWFWRVSGNAGTVCGGKGLAVKTSSRETVTVTTRTPSVTPGCEYCLRLSGQCDGTVSATAGIRFQDAARRETGKPLTYRLKNASGKRFTGNWRFSVPPDAMLMSLRVEYRLDGRTSAFFDTPRIFAAPQPKKRQEENK